MESKISKTELMTLVVARRRAEATLNSAIRDWRSINLDEVSPETVEERWNTLIDAHHTVKETKQAILDLNMHPDDEILLTLIF
jgi:hypothetical protein